MTIGWDRAAVVAQWRGLAPLASEVECDLCVVGLGGSGLAAAEGAAQRGLSVVGVDAGRVGGGAAGRNGGFLLGGVARFHHQVVAQLGETVATDLYRRTHAELDRLAERIGPIVKRTGSLRLAGLPGEPVDGEAAADREREIDDCREQLDALTASGIRAEWYEGPLGVGVFLPDDAAVNPAERCVAEAGALLLRPRVRLFEATPVLAVHGGRPARVVTAGGTVAATAVVICVDGGLEWVVPALAGRVRSARLQMLATEPLPPTLAHPVYGRWGYDYAQQDADGRVVVGGGRDRFVDDEWVVGGGQPWSVPPTGQVQAYLDRIAPRFAGCAVRVSDRWAGIVAFTDDGLPICELVDDGVAAAGAYSGTGNLVGPLVARAAAALALGEDPADWPLARQAAD